MKLFGQLAIRPNFYDWASQKQVKAHKIIVSLELYYKHIRVKIIHGLVEKITCNAQVVCILHVRYITPSSWSLQ